MSGIVTLYNPCNLWHFMASFGQKSLDSCDRSFIMACTCMNDNVFKKRFTVNVIQKKKINMLVD